MTERDMRAALAEACRKLDLRRPLLVDSGVLATLAPAVLGAGLAVAACETAGDVEGVYSAPFDGGTGGAGGSGGGCSAEDCEVPAPCCDHATGDVVSYTCEPPACSAECPPGSSWGTPGPYGWCDGFGGAGGQGGTESGGGGQAGTESGGGGQGGSGGAG
jgi:hypothetical protein